MVPVRTDDIIRGMLEYQTPVLGVILELQREQSPKLVDIFTNPEDEQQ